MLTLDLGDPGKENLQEYLHPNLCVCCRYLGLQHEAVGKALRTGEGPVYFGEDFRKFRKG